MAAQADAYMLNRNADESKRLDSQHYFVKDLLSGNLIHPYVTTEVHSVADVGTGTSLWLRDLRDSLRKHLPSDNQQRLEFVGFDISPAQFARGDSEGIDLVVHDATKSFPERYHEKFDLVHLRLLSFAIKEADLKQTVKNVCSIIRKYSSLTF